MKKLTLNTLTNEPAFNETVKFKGQWVLEAVDRFGRLKWRAALDNLVVTQGRNAILDITFGSVSKPSAWYIGLIEGSTAPVTSDTLASHGFTEYTGYTGNRKQWVTGSASTGTISTLNPASRAEFDFTETKDITGLMLCDQASGNTGILFAGALLATSKTLNNGDTLRVTYNVNATSA